MDSCPEVGRTLQAAFRRVSCDPAQPAGLDLAAQSSRFQSDAEADIESQKIGDGRGQRDRGAETWGGREIER